MRTSTLTAILILSLLPGCGGTPKDPAKVKPVVGSKVIVKDLHDIWKELPAMREQISLVDIRSPAFNINSPRIKEIDYLRVGMIVPGDMVEILEVGEDYAAVDVLAGGSFCEGRGGNGRLHGYTHSWWK
jgi:hypothetical protein